MRVCNSCPRACNIDRSKVAGICLASNEITVSHAMVHMWEEPFISGTKGSGTIFFSGCNLKCVYCQNHVISYKINGIVLTQDKLLKVIQRLQGLGVHNINFVTATHFTDEIIPVLNNARNLGINIPFIWNSSGYESLETLKKLEGLIDVYLPDFKYMDPTLSLKYSKAYDYPKITKIAIEEMFRQTGSLVIEDNLIKKGVVVRHLILPGLTEDSKDILDYLSLKYKNNIFISIMNQYYPPEIHNLPEELKRQVTHAEFNDVIDYALFSGIKNAITQSEDSRSSSYTPDFSIDLKDFLK